MKFMEILVSQGASHGGSSSARSFDLACPGAAPPLLISSKALSVSNFTMLDAIYSLQK